MKRPGKEQCTVWFLETVLSQLLFDWGKYYEKEDKIVIPISVQAHHSFVDGIHIGQFVEKLQKFFDEY